MMTDRSFDTVYIQIYDIQNSGVAVEGPLPTHESVQQQYVAPSQDNILSVPGEGQYLTSPYRAPGPHSRFDIIATRSSSLHPTIWVPEHMPPFTSYDEIGESQFLNTHPDYLPPHVETRPHAISRGRSGSSPYDEVDSPAPMPQHTSNTGQQQLADTHDFLGLLYSQLPSYPQLQPYSPGASSGYSGSETAVDGPPSFAELPIRRGSFSTPAVGPSNTPGTAHEANDCPDSLGFSAYSELTTSRGNIQFVTCALPTNAQLPHEQTDRGQSFIKKEMVATPANQVAALNRRQGKNKRLWACEACPQTFTAKHNLMNHMKSHLGIREYQCDFCKGAFGTKHVLKRHLKSCKKK